MAPAFVPGAHVVLFGPGYVGEAVCRHLADIADCALTRVTRSPAQAAQLLETGATAISSDDEAGVRAALAGATHVLSTVPPHSTGMDPVLAEFGDDLWGASGLQWAGYLSSTSVYADAGGGLVDETFETTPASPAGRARLAAEEGWRGRADVLRLAGVYGPGRSALATLSRDAGAMTRAEEAGDKLVSRVFVDDVVRAVAAAASAGREAAVYNVADDMPASRKAVFTCAARLLASAGVQPGEEGGEEGIGGQRYRFRTSKSVVNKRMKEELGVTLQFPTYMHGLAHLAVLEGLLGEGVVSS